MGDRGMERWGGGGCGDAESGLRGAGHPCPAWAEGGPAFQGCLPARAPGRMGLRPEGQQRGHLGSGLGSKRSIQ